MNIPLKREPPDMGGFERCCFCRAPTPMWTVLTERTPGEQVACCEKCAAARAPEEVPSKRHWCGIERDIRRKEGRIDR
jgi:hypothetical protein